MPSSSAYKQTLPNLELHLTHSCNLACESCSHYSNQGHRGMTSLSDASAWMKLWRSRLNPRLFSLLGGEPTIHPQLTEFVLLTRRNWPAAQIRIVTNGFFLHRHPNLPDMIRDVSNALIVISVHHASPEYQERLKPVMGLTNEWAQRYQIKIVTEQVFDHWTRRYHGFGSAMLPMEDNNPRRSWEICQSRYCPQLFEGKIWKCAPLAYLPMQHAKYNLSEKWKPYLEYQPLSPACTDAELAAFFAKEHESYCGMCSARLEEFELPLPFPK